jgi:putative membrane protein
MMHSGFGSGFGHYGSWLSGPGMFFHGPLGFVLTLLFLGLVISFAIKLFRTLFSGEKKSLVTHLDTLKERYARGEINEDEYHRMKTELV